MRIFKAIQGDGRTVTFKCPKLIAENGLPATKAEGWKVTNVGCCTILFEGDWCLTITSGFIGKGTKVILVATSVGDYRATTTSFSLEKDVWVKCLPQINAEIERCFAKYLKPSGWS